MAMMLHVDTKIRSAVIFPGKKEGVHDSLEGEQLGTSIFRPRALPCTTLLSVMEERESLDNERQTCGGCGWFVASRLRICAHFSWT